MTQHDDVKKNDEIYIWSKTTGFMLAHAAETKENRITGLAYFRVYLNSKALPGVTEMVINVNTWDVWLATNPEVLRKIADSFIRPEYER